MKHGVLTKQCDTFGESWSAESLLHGPNRQQVEHDMMAYLDVNAAA